MNRIVLVLAAVVTAGALAACRRSSAPPPGPHRDLPPAEAKAKAKTSSVATRSAGTDGQEAKAEIERAKALHPEAAWRDKVPEGGPPKPAVLPSFKSAKLKNGLTVLVPEEKALLPLVSFELVTKGGAATDPPDQAGVAALMYQMLNEGAGTREALQFADAVADLGAQFGSNADRDRGSAVIGGLKRNADAMAALLADAVIRPRMQDKDFKRRKDQLVAVLERNRGSPQGLAFEALPSLIYGPEHPYGHPPNGTVETIQKLSLDDVKKARARILGPQSSALVAAGDITLEEAVKLAEKHFGRWTATTPALPNIGAVDVSSRTEVVIIDKAPAPQTMIAIGRPIFGKGHPDESAMTVLNEIYGGAFTSRLNMNLREDKGFTYGATSQSSYRVGVGVFVAYSAVRQDATAQALQEFFSELDGLKARPPAKDEVDLAKAGIIRGLTGNFERTAAAAIAADAIYIYDLPLDYYTKLGAKFEAVDEAAVKKAVESWLKPELMKVLLVGDAGAIKPGVELDRLGQVVVKDRP